MGRVTCGSSPCSASPPPRRDKDHDISPLCSEILPLSPLTFPLPKPPGSGHSSLRRFTRTGNRTGAPSRSLWPLLLADAAAKASVVAAEVARLAGLSGGEGGGGGGGGRSGGLFGFSPKERSAAMTIQTMFRGFLARKALRALKGLVKRQALVRGFLVRKRATVALRSIRALMRAQEAARLRRSRRIPDNECSSVHECDDQSHRSLERFSDQPTPIHSSRRTQPFNSSPYKDNPKIPEVVDLIARPKSLSSRKTTTSDSMSDSYHPIMSSPQTPRFSKSYDICYYNECYDTWDNDQLGRRPGYMAKTLSFRAKWRSHQRQRMPFLTNKEAASTGTFEKH